MDQAASPKKRVIFDEDAYDADWWRETCAYYQSQEEEFWKPYDPNNPDPFLSSDFMQEDFDVAVSDLSSFFEGEHGGNHIIARGSIGRWDGVRHGMTPYDGHWRPS